MRRKNNPINNNSQSILPTVHAADKDLEVAIMYNGSGSKISQPLVHCCVSKVVYIEWQMLLT